MNYDVSTVKVNVLPPEERKSDYEIGYEDGEKAGYKKGLEEGSSKSEFESIILIDSKTKKKYKIQVTDGDLTMKGVDE